MKQTGPFAASASLRAASGDTLIFTSILLIGIGVVPVVLWSDWLAFTAIDKGRIGLMLALLAAALLGYFVFRRGHRTAAGGILLASVWVSVTTFAFATGIGLHTAAVYLYMPCLLYAGLFFGLRVAAATTLLTIAALVAMYQAEVSGLIGGVQVYLSATTPFNFMLGVIVSCVTTMILAVIYQRRIDQESASVLREAEARRRAIVELEDSQEALRRTHAEVRTLNAELERAIVLRTRERDQVHQELESVNYSVAHDLRAPLRAMHSYASMVMERAAPALDEESRDMLQRVREAADRMDMLLRALLTFGDIGRRALRIEPVNLSAISAEAIDRRARALGVEAPEARIDPALRALGDRQLVTQLIEALIDNAVKFGRHGAAPEIEIGATETDGVPTFFVRDRGIGFDPAQADMLGRPFHHLHADRELDGIGMGLASARRIAERHGGALWARASPGEGATFYFSLNPPAAKAA